MTPSTSSNHSQASQILSQSDLTFFNLVLLFKLKTWQLIRVVLIVIGIGFVVYLTTPNSYQINTLLLVETNPQGASSKGLGALAQVSGINLGASSSDQAFLDPNLYPVIVQSKPFLLELMTSKVKSELYPDSVSLFKYMVETKPENGILKILKNPLSVFRASASVDDLALVGEGKSKSSYLPLEIYAMSQIAKRIAISTEGSLLTISTEMPEQGLSLQFSERVRHQIEVYSSRYILEKQSGQVEYLNGQFLIAERNFKDAQNAVSRFREQNQGIALESLRAREQNLVNDSNLKFDLYRTLAQELELAKVKLNSLRPIFSEIDPPVVPNKPTNPKLILTLAFSAILGFFLGLAYVFFGYLRLYLILQKAS